MKQNFSNLINKLDYIMNFAKNNEKVIANLHNPYGNGRTIDYGQIELVLLGMKIKNRETIIGEPVNKKLAEIISNATNIIDQNGQSVPASMWKDIIKNKKS